MNTWPNWVDLLVVILILRACYIGVARGMVTEAVALIGAISITVFTLNTARAVREWDQLALWADSILKTWVLFWGLFLLLALAMRLIVKRVDELIKRVHWSMQSVGGILGAARGLWWSGFFLIALSSSGIPALRRSVEERSLIGSR